MKKKKPIFLLAPGDVDAYFTAPTRYCANSEYLYGYIRQKIILSRTWTRIPPRWKLIKHIGNLYIDKLIYFNAKNLKKKKRKTPRQPIPQWAVRPLHSFWNRIFQACPKRIRTIFTFDRVENSVSTIYSFHNPLTYIVSSQNTIIQIWYCAHKNVILYKFIIISYVQYV